MRWLYRLLAYIAYITGHAMQSIWEKMVKKLYPDAMFDPELFFTLMLLRKPRPSGQG